MKKTPFLSYILAALLVGSGIPQVQAETRYELKGNDILDMKGTTVIDADLYVTNMNNKLINGKYEGNGQIVNGELILEDAELLGYKGDEKWTMGNNSRLDLGGSEILLTQLVFTGQSIVLDNGIVTLLDHHPNYYTMGGSISGTAEINLKNNSCLNLNGKTISNHLSFEGGVNIGTGGFDSALNGGMTGISLTKVDAGTLYIEGRTRIVFLFELDVQGGSVSVTGTAEDKATLCDIQAAEGSTITLVHTNASLGYEVEQCFKGNLVIGNGSTVTAGCTDAWGYNSSNSLTIEKGGRLDMDDQRWTFAACNKITLAGGEITGQHGDENISLDFCGGDNEVLVRENSTLSAPIRVRGGDSVTFNVLSGKLLTFSGDIVSNGDFNDDKGTIYKTGSGIMVMSGSNAMSNGTINVQGGTLITNSSCGMSNGTINVKDSTLKIAGGANSLGNTAVSLQNNATLDMGGNTHALNLTVTGTGNTMKNGSLTGTLTLEEGSYLKSIGALASWDGPTSIVMNNGSTLEMELGQDIWINRLPALQVNGKATITNAFLRVRSSVATNHEYVLTDGVANLQGSGTYYVLTGDEGNDYFNLGKHDTNFSIIAWETFNEDADVCISNGKIAKSVEIRGISPSSNRLYSKLRLTNTVTIAKDVVFTMGDGAQLDMGGAEGIAWLNLADHTTVTVSNGRMGLPGAPDNPLDAMEYTLTTNQDGTPVSIEGGYKKVKLGANVTFATRHNTRYVVADSTVPANIDVVAEGHFLLGKGSGTRLHANVSITHTGEGPSDPGTNDVDLIYWLIGDLDVKMGGRSISAGVIGDYQSTEEQTSTASITGASKISLEAFTGKSMKLQASESVLLTGATKASGKVEIGGSTGAAAGSACPEIRIQTILQADELEMSGKTITGSGNPGGDENPTWLAFTTGTIEATDTISITQEIRGGDMTMKAGKSITLDLLGMGDPLGMGEHTLGSADITSDTAGITAKSFTGGALKATAINGAVTINGAVNATSDGKWEPEGIGIADPLAVAIKGTSVSINGSLDAGAETGRVYIKSTGGNITIGKDSSTTLSAGDSSTLDSAAGITVLGNVTHGNLKASAGQSITLQAIAIDDRAAELTAGADITATSFNGATLEASATGAVTFHGSVNASGSAYIESTGGNISIGENLSAAVSSTLDSAGNITIGTLDSLTGQITGGYVTGGDLTATAAQSILVRRDIGTTEHASGTVQLTAQTGSITAGNFNGGSLNAKAAEAVAFSGDVASSNNAELTSTAGDIKIGGTLTSGTSSTLRAGADIIIGTLDEDGNITSGGDVTGGALTATAAQSIKLGNIGLNNSMAAELTATGGSITAGAFTGGSLKANANADLTLNGDVTAAGDAEWQLTPGEETLQYAVMLEGSGVSVNGSLTASLGMNYIKSTGGDISVAGDLSAWVSSTLDSEGSIILGTLNDKGEITAGGNVTCGHLIASARGSIKLGAFSADDLTASAGDSIKVGNIGSTSQAVGTVQLTATNGGITAGNVNAGALTATAGQSIMAGKVTAGKLTATAAGTITLSDVAVSQSEAQIVSTGEGGNVVLRSFSGGGALIKATHGSITVASGVTGSASTNKNTFIAAGSVTFNGATGNNGLEHAIINAPQVNWSNGTTLKDVTVAHWAPPANSPLLLPAATEDPVTTLTVNGFLELTDYSTVNGNVVINKQDNIIPEVTVDHSIITGRVSGATELVLNSGRVGNVVVDNNRPNDLTVVSSGTSSITGVPFDPYVESYAKLRIATLSLNGGKLTVSPKAQDYPDYPDDMETSDEEKARLQVATLMVANNTTVAADLELLPIGENEFSTMIFNLSAANETTACLTLEGDLLSYIPGFDPTPGGKISISLNGNADVEGGKRYALIATNYDDKPEFWNDKNLTLTVSGLAQKTDDLSWDNGTLYFQNGGELTRAVWSPDTSHQWNTTDQNWLQDGYRYRYKDGVTVVFDDTGKGGVVELEGDCAPGEVQVNNSAGNDYTFTGSGKITGESTKLIKMGSGTLTIQTANSYGGGTTINAGTLVVANDEALGSGEVILEGGALEIDNGPKKFRLTVTGKNTRLEGGGHDAFTGTLTLKAGSQLNSSGGALMATQYGIDHIVMENGSTLTMTSDEDSAHRIWINKISEFTVYAGTEQDSPKLADTYLYIDSGLTYKLGATTGENINSLQNLRGEGSTAFLLDSSTLDLNSKTTKLNIIVDNVLPQGPSTVMGGEIDANVVVCERVKPNPFTEPNELEVTNARIGNNASISLGAGTRLIMSDVALEAGATFSMGNEAYLDLGGTFAHPSSVSLGAFTFTGANATIDNGSLYVERKETGAPVVLGTHLSGSDTRVSLHEEASLDLGGHVLSVTEVNMSEDAASASIGNGTLNSDLAVESGKTLHLGNALTIAGNLSGGGTITKENDGTASVSGGMKGFTGNVQVQGGELNIMGIAEAASLKVADVTIMSGTLGVYQGGTTGEENEGTLTIRNGSKLAAGHGAQLNANLVMEGGSTLDVHSTEGAGLLMGSTVTLSKGMTLKDYSADWATWKVGTKYVLFSGVDGLSIGGDMMTGTLDYTQWVDAKEYFTNIEESNRYFLCYGGAPDQSAQGILTAVNDGSNVGMVYIMAMPEPTTSTLSLLALAGLAARRRRK